MVEELIHILIFIGLVTSAYLAVEFRDLVSSVISLAIFSFSLTIEFYMLQAPNVAIAEAGIGAEAF